MVICSVRGHGICRVKLSPAWIDEMVKIQVGVGLFVGAHGWQSDRAGTEQDTTTAWTGRLTLSSVPFPFYSQTPIY